MPSGGPAYPGPGPAPRPAVGVPAPAAPAGSGAGRRLGLLIAGLVLAVAGIVAGLLILGSASTDDAVKKFARAPIGCSTTMSVEETGTFNIYLESKGRLPEYGGDCPAAGTYSSDGRGDVPEVVITRGDNDIDLTDAGGESYDAAGYAGHRVFTAKLEKGETYRITVTSDDADAAEQMAIAVGVDSSSPSKLSSAKTMGIAALIAGPVLGLLLIGLGLRRRSATAGPGPGPSGGTPVAYQPVGMPPTGVPGPAAYQPGPPPAQPGWNQPPGQPPVG